MGGNAHDLDPFFAEAIELATQGVELAAGRHDARTVAQRQRGKQAHEEVVRRGTKRVVTAAVVQQARIARAHAIGHLLGAIPLLVHELRRVLPGALLPRERHVGPGLVRVPGQEQPVGDVEPRVVSGERIGTREEILGIEHGGDDGCGPGRWTGAV